MVWPSFKPAPGGNHSNLSGGGGGGGGGKEGDAIGVVLLSAGVVGGAGYVLIHLLAPMPLCSRMLACHANALYARNCTVWRFYTDMLAFTADSKVPVTDEEELQLL